MWLCGRHLLVEFTPYFATTPEEAVAEIDDIVKRRLDGLRSSAYEGISAETQAMLDKKALLFRPPWVDWTKLANVIRKAKQKHEKLGRPIITASR